MRRPVALLLVALVGCSACGPRAAGAIQLETTDTESLKRAYDAAVAIESAVGSAGR